jgi:hypothetical protein
VKKIQGRLNKTVVAVTIATVLTVGLGVAVFASFGGTAGGDSTGSTTPAIQQASLVFNNAGRDIMILPGTTATVTFTVDNTSSASEHVGSITLGSWTSAKSDCNSALYPTWITMSGDAVNGDFGPGSSQAVPGTGLIRFNYDPAAQRACMGLGFTFSYVA